MQQNGQDSTPRSEARESYNTHIGLQMGYPGEGDGGHVDAEDPPDYSQDEAPPSYDSDITAAPVVRYKLQRWDRCRQRFVSLFTSGTRTSFAVSTRTKPRLFTSGPDIQILVEKKDRKILPDEPLTAAVNFDDGAHVFPYFPRATMKIVRADGGTQEILQMDSNDFVHWRIDLDGISHYWCLKEQLCSALVLKNILTGAELATWTYGEFGMDASHGNYAGELVIPSGGSELRDLILLCSCYVVLVHWRKMGRRYRNETVTRL